MYLNKSLAITDILFLINFKCTIHFVPVEFIIKKFLKINTKMLHFFASSFYSLTWKYFWWAFSVIKRHRSPSSTHVDPGAVSTGLGGSIVDDVEKRP